MRALILAALLPTLASAAPRVQPELPPADARFTAGTAVDNSETDRWWTAFGDEALDSLVVEALENNPDIGSAQARMHQAVGVSMQSLSPLLPNVSFDVGIAGTPKVVQDNSVPPQQQASFDQMADAFEALEQFMPPDDGEDEEEEPEPEVTWNGSAVININWSIDLGSSAAALRAAKLDEAAARGDRNGVARQVVQQVVASWLDVRNARARLDVIRGQVDTNANLLELTRRRFEGGDARGLDVLQQQQQLQATRAMLPQAEQALRLREIQLATLLGRDPSRPALPEGAGVPDLPPAPGVGTPAELLENRPDVVAADTRFEASKARVTSSALSMAPTIQLGANVGKGLRHYNEWDSWDTYGANFGVSVPIFSGLRRHGALQQSLAARDAAAHALTSAARSAIAEVETALAREVTEAARLEALNAQLVAAQTAYEESARQYAGGLVNYLTVLTSLASYQAAELNLLQARRDVLGARTDLHTALGSRWARRLQ